MNDSEGSSRSTGRTSVTRRAHIGLFALGAMGIASAGLFSFGTGDSSRPVTPQRAEHSDAATSLPDTVPKVADHEFGIAGDTETNRTSIRPSLRIVDDVDETPIAAATIEFLDSELRVLATAQCDADGEVALPSEVEWRAGSAAAPGYGIAGFERGQSVVRLHRAVKLEVVFVDDAGEIGDGTAAAPLDPGMTFELVIRDRDYEVGDQLAARAAVAAYARFGGAQPVSSRTWRPVIAQPLGLAGILRASFVHEATGERTYLGLAKFAADDRRVVLRVRNRFRHAGAEWCGVRVKLPHPLVSRSIYAQVYGRFDIQSPKPTQPSVSAPRTLDGDRFDMTLLHRPPTDAVMVVRLITANGLCHAIGPIDLVVGGRVEYAPWSAATTLELEFLDAKGRALTERVDWMAEIENPPKIFASENLGPGHVRIRHLPPGAYRMRSALSTPRSFEIRPNEPVRVTIAADPRGPRVPFTVRLPSGTSARFLDPSTRRVVQVVLPATKRVELHTGSYTLEFERADGRVETSAVEVRMGAVLDLR